MTTLARGAHFSPHLLRERMRASNVLGLCVLKHDLRHCSRMRLCTHVMVFRQLWSCCEWRPLARTSIFAPFVGCSVSLAEWPGVQRRPPLDCFCTRITFLPLQRLPSHACNQTAVPGRASVSTEAEYLVNRCPFIIVALLVVLQCSRAWMLCCLK